MWLTLIQFAVTSLFMVSHSAYYIDRYSLLNRSDELMKIKLELLFILFICPLMRV